MQILLHKLPALHKFRLKYLFVLILFFGVNRSTLAQCPPNIDFEQGGFAGWQCYIGTFSFGTLTLNPSPPTANRHEIIPAIPANLIDPYGNFPQHCPNGSNYSIKLGNNATGGQAEKVSYTFT